MRGKHFFLCALVFFGNGLGCAQSSRTLVDDLVWHWQQSKSLALTMAKTAPDNLYVRTTPGQKEDSSASQLNGVALVSVLACTMALRTRAPERLESVLDEPMDSSKAGVIENLTEAYDYCINGLKAMRDGDLFRVRGFKLRPEATIFDIYWEGYAHATYILGEAAVFMRSKGLTLPVLGGPEFDF